MVTLIYGDTLYGERLHVLLSMVLSNCLGERAPPSLVLSVWCYLVWRFVNNMCSFNRLSAILQVEYRGIDMKLDPMENYNLLCLAICHKQGEA